MHWTERHRASASGIAAGSISAAKVEVDELFDKDDICAIIGEATSTFSSLASGAGKGVSPERRLAKIWTISPEDENKPLLTTLLFKLQAAQGSIVMRHQYIFIA